MKDIELRAAYEVEEEDVVSTPAIYTIRSRKYMWPLEVYKEWYEYSLLNGYKGTFDEWFVADTYAEPVKEDAVKVKSLSNELVLTVNLGYDTHRIMKKIENVINRHKKNNHNGSRAIATPSIDRIKSKTLAQDREIYALKQKGVPVLEIAYKLDMLATTHDNGKCRTEPISTKEVYAFHQSIVNKEKQRSDYDSAFEEACDASIAASKRKVHRAIERVEKILKNLKRRIFP